MKTLNLIQGSPEWLAVRANHFTASEAAAMLGFSDKVKRSELLHMKATGTEREFSDWVQKNLLDKGHEVEAAARVIVEARLADELYPVTGTLEVEGLQLLASFDGITMLEDVTWENKMWNAALVEYLNENGDAPQTHWPQLEQQLLISGAPRALFTVSDGTEERTVELWYEARPERRAQLIGGWKQFRDDLKNYQYVEPVAAAVAAPIMELPALIVQVDGRVVSSNLAAFQGAAVEFIRNIKTDLQNDQDFADAEKTVKFCKDGEDRLELVKSQALAQTASIDELFRTIDLVKEEMRGKRLELEKLVKARKESIRVEIQQRGKDALAAHIDMLNKRLGKPYMPSVAADFTGAMKGKKTVASLNDAVDTELARAKIEANACADRITINLNTLRDIAADRVHLFPDTALIVLKNNDDVVSLIKARIADEESRLEAARQAAQAAQVEQPAKPEPASSVVGLATAPVARAVPQTHAAPKPTARTILQQFVDAYEAGNQAGLRDAYHNAVELLDAEQLAA